MIKDQQLTLKDKLKTVQKIKIQTVDGGTSSIQQEDNEAVDTVTRIQSTVQFNSIQHKAQLSNKITKTAKESRTTDDLMEMSEEPFKLNQSLFQSIPSAEIYPKVKGIRNKSTVIQELRSQTSLAVKTPQMPPILKGSLNEILRGTAGDYISAAKIPLNSQSVNIIDSLPTFHSQFKKNKAFVSESRGSIFISKQDMINFQKNGSLSKEFIHQNKKELESFIKLNQRNKIDTNVNQSLIQEQKINGLQYTSNDRIDGSNTKIKNNEDDDLVNINDGQFHINLREDVKPEKAFQGVSSKISSKVIENWINSTLADAEHLDIPSVILKPKNKIPITNYGIDKNTLTAAGLSSDMVERIYKSLFVYSVGFFELLKQQMQNCSEEDKLTLLMNLWKTYCVLLEYSCKTDYQMFITKVTKQYDKDKQQITDKFNFLIDQEIQEKKLLRQNMQMMQVQMENFEKERNNEKNLRLKLEEEYMTITRNHEEEVGLRLQFEARVNQLNTEYRELDIKFSRINQQLQQQNSNVDRLSILSKQQAESLIQLRTEQTDHMSQIETLSNFKQSAVKEIEKKTQLLRNVEIARKNAADMLDTAKYQLQDSDNQARRQELRIQDLQVGKIALTNQIQSLETQIVDLKNLDEIKQKQLEKDRFEYEELSFKYSKVYEELQIQIITSTDHTRLIKKLQQDIENFSIRKEDHEMQALIFRTQRDDLQREYTKTREELTETVDHLQAINKQRHYYEDLYNTSQKQIVQLEQEIINLNIEISNLKAQNQKLLEQVTYLNGQIEKLQNEMKKFAEQKEKQINQLNLTIANQTTKILNLSEDRDKWKEKSQKFDEIIKALESKIVFKDEVIAGMKEQIAMLEDKLQRQLSLQIKDMERIQISEKRASEAIRKQLQLEETIRYQRQKFQLIEDKLKKQIFEFETKIILEHERNNMISEDAIGKYQDLKYLISPEYENKTNKRHYDEMNSLQNQVTVEKETNQYLNNQVNELQLTLDELQNTYGEICESLVLMEDKRFQELQTKLQSQTDSLNSEFSKLQEQYKFALEQNARLAQQMKESSGLVKKGTKREDNGFDKMIKDKKELQQKVAKATQNLIRKSTLNQSVLNNSLSDGLKQDSGSYSDLSANNITDSPNQKQQSLSPRTLSSLSNTNNEKIENNIDENKIQITDEQLINVSQQNNDLEFVIEDIQAEEDKGETIESTRDNIERVEKLRKIKFEEYRDYISNMNVDIFDKVKEKFNQILNKRDKIDLDKMDSIPQYIHRLFKLGAEQEMPDQFKFLRLSQDEKNLLLNDYEQQLSAFQILNTELFDQLNDKDAQQNEISAEEDPESSKSPQREINILPQMKTVKKKKKSTINDMFIDFARNHAAMIDRLIKENEERMALEALARRKTTKEPSSPKELIQGRQEYHLLIKMARAPDFYEEHRHNYIESIQKAQILHNQKQQIQERKASEEKRIADEVAKILLDRHRAKVAKIVVERPYLKEQQSDANIEPNIKQIKYSQSVVRLNNQEQKDEPNISSLSPFQNTNQQEEDDEIQYEQNLLMEDQNNSSLTVLQLIDKVKQLRKRQDNAMNEELDELIRGGVASVNKQAAISRHQKSQNSISTNSGQIIISNPSIRKKIRAAVSRIN